MAYGGGHPSGGPRGQVKLTHGYRTSQCAAPDLMTAIRSRDVAQVHQALEAGCDPNVCVDRRKHPLRVAVIQGDVSSVRLLLEHGASPLLSSESDPIQRAHAGPLNLVYTTLKLPDRQTMVDTLLQSRDALPLIMEYLSHPEAMEAATHKHAMRLLGKVLRDPKSPVDLQIHFRDHDNTVKTPLTLAVSRGDVTMARLLLDHGADVNTSMYQERCYTPLMVAAYRAPSGFLRHELVALLLARGANVNEQTERGNTALHMAIHRRASFDTLMSLLQHGADVTLTDQKGRTPYHTALLRVYYPAFRLLVEAGVTASLNLPASLLAQLTEPLNSWTAYFMGQPRPLRDICAISTRRALGSNMCSKVEALPLPSPIKNFLLLSQLDYLRPLFGSGKDSIALSSYAWKVP